MTGKPIIALAVDPTRPNYIYACTDGPSGSLWKSKDGGASWNIRNGCIQNLALNALLVDPANADRLLAATASGIFRSDVGGVNWLPARLSGKVINTLAVSRSSIFYYAGALDGLYSSLDGSTWQTVSGTGGHDILTIIPAGGDLPALRYGTRGRGSYLLFTSSSE